MITLKPAQSAMTENITTPRSSHAVGDDDVRLSRSSRKIAESTDPIMNRSPWAKLINSMMP